MGDLRQRARRANREMMRDKNERTVGVYKKLRNEYVGKIRDKKRDSWVNFVMEVA